MLLVSQSDPIQHCTIVVLTRSASSVDVECVFSITGKL